MVRYVDRSDFLKYLTSKGFKRTLEELNRTELKKVFFPGIFLNVVVFKGVPLYYRITLCLKLFDFFPEGMTPLAYTEITSVGPQGERTVDIKCENAQVDLDGFDELYKTKVKDLNQTCARLRKIPRLFK